MRKYYKTIQTSYKPPYKHLKVYNGSQLQKYIHCSRKWPRRLFENAH
ncbi:hypothetical protein PBCV1_a004aL [Paramecium bursaria Chlorella virus 1]|uniref:Uncharacterized protein n=1 Tax=Paramecium bursaria Chlorella virus 1 TaxID=10506 RepID=F8TTV8_PBCV1|nr:hypothetical protein PBCV1_a004aL [Paramecium bursaria Chlorella virus 1]AEI70019.1 hypothetical protein [Paramecium bursaria Chlorella virus 1]